MPSRLRKVVLIVHVATSVGWLGSVAAYIGLDLTATTSQDVETVRAMYLAMELTVTYVIVPLALTSVLVGVVNALGTPWGLFRHYWVLVKLLLTVFATTILLLERPTVSYLADDAVSRGDPRNLPGTLFHSVIGLVVLFTVLTLSVVKPRGLTRYGWRKQQERRRRRERVAAPALIVVVAGLALVPREAAADTIPPVKPCTELAGDYDLPGAATRVTAATPVEAGAEPAHCDVRGVVEPAVGFQLRLPMTTYSGRYLQYGCGGYCGFIRPAQFPDCGGPDAGDVAVAATDDGHRSQSLFPATDGTWAANNQAARDDWTYRAPHVVSRAAKRIIATYYGSGPRRSYFAGCSTGGREGLLLAQRYPRGFDGIIAGAPANILSPLLVYQAWLARSNTGSGGLPIITGAKLTALHDAVVAACDRLDGLTDGQIDDPRACRFDPVSIRCPAGTDHPTCLTLAQVDAARKLYAGPTDEAGRRLYPGWQARGSELAWNGHIVPSPGTPGARAALFADNYLRYIGYPIGTPSSSLAEFQFTLREFDRLTPEGVKANAMSLDLSEFRRAGGKLILWHGWADQEIPAVGTVDYYRRLARRTGGQRSTQEWARLFMVPGMYHCSTGGDKLTEFGPIGPFRELVAWVERGTAPERVIATGRDAAGNVTRTRPVFRYPLRARYDGTGSVDDESNFVPARPLVRTRDTIRWAGEDLYDIPGPAAP